MPLLGTTKYQEYKVLLEDNVGEVHHMYVVAQDAEHAAWNALELSIQRDCKLKDVRSIDEW